MIDVSMIKANLAPRSFPVKRKINSTNAFPCLLSRCHPHDKVVPPAPRPPGMPAQAYSLDPQWAAVREHYRHYLQTLLTLTGTGPRAAAGCPLSFSSLFFLCFFCLLISRACPDHPTPSQMSAVADPSPAWVTRGRGCRRRGRRAGNRAGRFVRLEGGGGLIGV